MPKPTPPPFSKWPPPPSHPSPPRPPCFPLWAATATTAMGTAPTTLLSLPNPVARSAKNIQENCTCPSWRLLFDDYRSECLQCLCRVSFSCIYKRVRLPIHSLIEMAHRLPTNLKSLIPPPAEQVQQHQSCWHCCPCLLRLICYVMQSSAISQLVNTW